MSEAKERNLSVTLRPRRLSDLIGQEALVDEIRTGMTKRIPIGIMLVGESGNGKTTIAKILADAVQCDHGQFGDTCDACLENHELFHITEQNCAELGKIEDIKASLVGLRNNVAFGKYRVFIFDEAHEIGAKAQEVLYIPMEDEDAPNIFILPTTDPKKLLEPIFRRCKIFQVPGLNADGIHRLVESTIVRAEGSLVLPAAPLVTALLQSQIYSPGFIVTAVERYLDGVAPELAVTVKDASRVDIVALISAVSKGKWTQCQKLLSQATPADVDGLKTRLAGYFRKIMLDPTNSLQRIAFASDAVHELSGNNASTVYETGFQLSILTASIFKICQMVENAVAMKKGPARDVTAPTSTPAVLSFDRSR